MRLRQTSLQAYQDIENDGTMGKQASKIYGFVKKDTEGYTRNEISRFLGISINAVCGRVRELLDAEWLLECGRKRDRFTGKENYVIKARCNT